MSKHCCYIIRSEVYNKIYIGYTVNFARRLRQHNGEITGGAKRTMKWRPWIPVCIIEGFNDSHIALRIEYRLQHPRRRIHKGKDATEFVLENLSRLIDNMDGLNPWPNLNINWYTNIYRMHHETVDNYYNILS
jgi:structure-specific endonuclease subunit SLX1